MFGQPKPVFGSSPSTGFGFGSTQFGTSATTSQPTAGLFGQPVSSTQQTNVFGSSVFGGAGAAISGTTVKFNPPLVNDLVQKNGQKVQVNAKHMCISAMKEYSDKSMEELRVEDYMQNRKSGSAAATKSIFGSTSTSGFGFGTAQTTASSLFGSTPAAQTTQSSLFGSTNTNSIFGSSQPMSAFGQSSIFGSKPLFGSPTTNATGLNLSNNQQPSTGFGFGQNTQQQGSIFGSGSTFGAAATTASSFGVFGSQPSSTQSSGFSFGKPAGSSIFGAATTTTSSLFGSTQPTVQASPFGAPSTSQTSNIFGAVKPAGTSLFGTTPATTASAFGFGAKTNTTSLFSATPANNTTGFGLGTSTSNTLQTGLFGAKKPSPFGTPASSATPAFAFGAATNTAAPATNLFGNSTGFGLGSIPQATQPATGGIFGSTNTGATGGLFNKPATNAFGFNQPSASTPSLFGITQNTGTGVGVNLFGNTNTTGGLGTSLGFGGLTGSTITPFSANTAQNAAAQGPLVEELTQHARAQQHVLDMVRSMPYGQSSLFKHLDVGHFSSTASSSVSTVTITTTSTTVPKTPGGGSVMTVSAAANTIAELHKTNSLGRSPARIGKGFVTRGPIQQVPLNKRQLFTGFQEDDALVSAQSPMSGNIKSNVGDISLNKSNGAPDSRFFVRRDTWKRLNIPSCVRNSIIERSSLAVSDLEQQQIEENDETESQASSNVPPPRSPKLTKGAGDAGVTGISSPATRVKFLDNATSTPLSNRSTGSEDLANSRKQALQTPQQNASNSPTNACDLSVDANWTMTQDNQLASPSIVQNGEASDPNCTATTNRAGIRLSKPGYYMFPTLDELVDLIDESGRCVVQDFVIGRQSYGHILFPGLTDITGIDFDEVVHIRRREVVVYPDDSVKPPQGYGLNRKAEVTLDGVWPTDKSTREFIKSPQRIATMKFDERLEKYTQKMDATFIEYRPDTGSWVFEVKHFSKYRLDDSDDEEEPEIPSQTKSVNERAVEVDKPRKANVDSDKIMEIVDSSIPESVVCNASRNTWHSPRGFKGVRDFLFSTGSSMEENGGMEYDDIDDQADFLSRRLSQKEKAFNLPQPTQFENTISLELNDIPSFTKKTSRFIDQEEQDITAAAGVLKFDALQSVHNPTACDHTLLLPKMDKKKLCSVPYDRIQELVGKSIDFRLSCFDAGFGRGDVARLCWSLFPRKDLPPQLVLLTSDPTSDPPAHVVASSVPVHIDPQEELLLNSALETSTQTAVELDFCPLFRPQSGPCVLESYLGYLDSRSRSTEDSECSEKMRALHRALLLCQALWARHDDTLGLHEEFVPCQPRDFGFDKQEPDELVDISSRESVSVSGALNDLSRRQAVSEWIRAELRPWLDGRLRELKVAHLLSVKDASQTPWNLSEKVTKSAVYEGIFACLCCGETGLACRLALICRMSHLASCLSMAAISDPLCKRGLQKQLRVWNELKVLPFMPQPILRTYALLAGEIKVPITGNKGKTVMNVLADVPYLQALGVHLWYLVDHSTDLASALRLFSNNWHACDTFEVAPPRPPEDTDLKMSKLSSSLKKSDGTPSQTMLSRSSSRDVCYHLLRLATRPWHSLERTLDPQSIRSSPKQRQNQHQPSSELLVSDSSWSSSWHLWRVLMSLGLGSLNPIATARLHEELASHLEAGGLWEWAVFALMHEADPRVRAASVKRLIARNVKLQLLERTPEGQWRLDGESASRFNEAESFILQRFGVPVKWLHEAKACLARSLLASHSSAVDADTHRLLASLEAAHWLASQHYDAAHEVYMKHLLPDIILHSSPVSVSSVLADAHLATGGCPASLATKLMTVLQPFNGIPRDSLPSVFEKGVEVYVVYARILSLVYQLSLCNKTEEERMEGDSYMEDSQMRDISDILEDLLANAQQLVDLLQSMPTPTVRDRVIKSEIAVTVIRLISVFLNNDLPLKPEVGSEASEGLDEKNSVLCQRLKLLTNIDLPSEAILSEVEALTATGISQRVF
nr:nuclear pore complex protein Nup98 Nup96 [Hymenolepis microstoma]